jgi:MFS family permease
LIIMRLLAGTGGSAVMSIAPAIVADLYPVERRSFAMGIVLVRSIVSEVSFLLILYPDHPIRQSCR